VVQALPFTAILPSNSRYSGGFEPGVRRSLAMQSSLSLLHFWERQVRSNRFQLLLARVLTLAKCGVIFQVQYSPSRLGLVTSTPHLYVLYKGQKESSFNYNFALPHLCRDLAVAPTHFVILRWPLLHHTSDFVYISRSIHSTGSIPKPPTMSCSSHRTLAYKIAYQHQSPIPHLSITELSWVSN
jgi:hypothetical protein